MDWLHSTWFWIVIAAAPFVVAIGTLARLAKKEPTIDFPDGVAPGTYRSHSPSSINDPTDSNIRKGN